MLLLLLMMMMMRTEFVPQYQRVAELGPTGHAP